MRNLTEQVDRLIALGVPAAIGIGADRLREAAAPVLGGAARTPEDAGALLVLHPRLAPASALAPLLELAGKPGFVVPDMTDLDEFADIEGLGVPEAPVYAVLGPERGDELANRTPADALPEIRGRGRTPLTINEGICWLLQEPGLLEKNHCFMTIGSRKRVGSALDKRVPALWISGGPIRDGGPERRGAPKLGWCWAGNWHAWLGFASAATRIG